LQANQDNQRVKLNSLVSIVITTHNRAELVVKTIESVLSQTYQNIEVIVVDNESSDDTRRRLYQFGDRIKYFHKKNEGACSARNFGINQSQGEYIGLLDSDDTYLPDKIECSVKYLDENPDVALVHTAAYFTDIDGCIVSKYSHSDSRYIGQVLNRLLVKNFICNSTVVLRKTCLQKSGLFDEDIFSPADWDLWIRLSEHFEVGFIDQPLTKYRASDNYILKNLEKSQEEESKVLKKYFYRHNEDAGVTRKKAFSSLYLRYAQAHLVKSDFKESKKNFIASLKIDPFNLKAVIMFIYFIFARKDLAEHLKIRIIRV